MQISKAHELMAKALDARAIRQDLISSNISNVDTPFYRPRDLNFENVLNAQAQKTFNAPRTPSLELAKTDASHVGRLDETPKKSTVFFRDGHLARNDGNSVDLDVETTEMSKNSLMFNALSASVKKEALIFKSVITASEKLN